MIDPRPDLKADSAAWTILLTVAERHGHEPLMTLNGLRCLGARLLVYDKLYLKPGGEMTAQEYAADRARWLVPYREVLDRVFADAYELMPNLIM